MVPPHPTFRSVCREWLSLVAIVFAVLGCQGCRLRGKPETSKKEATQLVDEARDAVDQGNVLLAQELLTAAIETDPKDCELRLQLSELLKQHGSLAAARIHLEKAVDQDPVDPRPLILLAQTEYELREYDAADEHARAVIEIDPHHVQAITLRGEIAELLGNGQLATQFYFDALTFDPNLPKVRFLTARQLFQQGATDQAAPMFRRLTEEPQVCGSYLGEAWWLLGQCYSDQLRWKESAQALSAGIALRSPSLSDWKLLAESQLRAGEFRAARSSIESAKTIDPNDTENIRLSELLDKIGDPPVRLTDGTKTEESLDQDEVK